LVPTFLLRVHISVFKLTYCVFKKAYDHKAAARRLDLLDD